MPEVTVRNVVFVAPFPLQTTMRFARAIAGLDGVRLLGLFQEAPADRSMFADIAQVGNALDARELAAGVARLRDRWGPIHRLPGVLEDLQIQLAEVREALGIFGPGRRVAEAFRDKATMKDMLRAAGVPVARHRVLHDEADARAFVGQVGFPIVLKPPAGSGCRATYRVGDEGELTRALAEVRLAPHRPTLAEEFLTGEEFSFETITVGGQIRFHSISRYLPTPLEVVRNEWIKWVVILPRDISGPEFDPIRQVAVRVLDALGRPSGITHMEWFRRPDGSVAVGEIAMRPPGAQIVRLMSYAHDTDLYRAWARAVVDDAFDGPWERRFSTGCAFLRGVGQGRVVDVSGLEQAQKEMGSLVVEAELPSRGAPKSSSYEGDGYAILRHPDTRVVEEGLARLIRAVHVHYR